MVVWHLAVRLKPEDLKAALLGKLCLLRHEACALPRFFFRAFHCREPQRIPSPDPALLKGRRGMRDLTGQGRSHSMTRKNRCRPDRDAAIAESRTRRMREAR